MNTTWPLLSPKMIGGAVFLALCGAIGYVARQRQFSSQRAAALERLKSVCYSSSEEKYSLNGSTASIVKCEESDLIHNGRSECRLTVYLRNEAGEYFMVMPMLPKPYVKHMSHESARAILKGKYVSPPPA
jgi:hypothetical protein